MGKLGEREVDGNSLYFLLDFSVNQKFSKKSNLFIKNYITKSRQEDKWVRGEQKELSALSTKVKKIGRGREETLWVSGGRH